MHKKKLMRPTFKQLITLLLSLWLSAAFADEEASLLITRASLSERAGVYFLNAEIDQTLSDEAIEALNNGVTLTFSTDFNITEARAWLWPKRHYARHLTSQLKYHTLAETYQVTDASHQQHHFSSLWAALLALGTFQELPLHDFTPSGGTPLIAELKTQLNIEALPLPMRPLAYLTPGWHLSSPRFQWPINP